ncbi:MAG: hypothetical protein ACOH16_05225 [Propionibacteriaceae bacterium]
MGQNPVNPNPEHPQYPQSGGSGPSVPGFGAPTGPGYSQQGQPYAANTPPGYGPQSPMSAPAYPPQPTGPAQAAPFPQQGANPYGAPGAPAVPPYGQPAGRNPAGPSGGPVPNPYGAPTPNLYAGPGVPPPRPSRPPKRKGLLIGLIAGGVALLLIAVIGVVGSLRMAADAASTEPDKASKSATALKGYLDALAAGDADKAKRYAMNPPAESPFLTGDFLKSTLAKNPITEVAVEAKTDYGTSSFASASYRIGSTLVQGRYELTKVGKVWKLDDVVTTVKRPTYWGKLPVTINGTAAPSDSLAFFPGVYELGTGTPLLDFATASFTVKEPGGYVSGLSSSAPQLSAKGKATIISKSQEWLNQCLAAQETNPKSCGMNTPLPNGATLAAGTMTRTVTSSGTPFATASPRVSSSDPSKVTMSSYVAIKVEAKDAAGKVYQGSASVSTVTGTISGENITVVFDE